MEKYKEIHQIVCPFCGKKPKRLDTYMRNPGLYCEHCKVELVYRKSFFNKYYIFQEFKEKEFCKNHQELVYYSDDGCQQCKQEKVNKELKKMNFTKRQLNFISNNHYNIVEAIEETYKIYGEDD